MSSFRIAFLFCSPSPRCVVACGDGRLHDDSGTTETVSLDDCTPGAARDGQRRHADHRHRQARRSRRTSRTTTRPTARASRAPSPTRSPTSSASPRTRSKWIVEPFNSSYAPGPEGLRLRRQPDLDHAEARRAGRLLVARITRPTRRSSRSRTPTRPARRRSPTSPTPRSASRSAPRASTRSTTVIEPSYGPAGLRHLQRRRHGAQAGPGRRGRRRRARRPST